MPPVPFFDVTTLDPSRVLAAHHAAIYQVNPHRYEFENARRHPAPG